MLLLSIMVDAIAGVRPARLSRWEFWIIAAVVSLCLVLSLMGKGRRQRQAYENFLEHASMIQQAAERFAADHGGKFPPDGMHTSAPWGLSEKYLRWDRAWNIDYDVHDNGHGGRFVCLEYCGPYDETVYAGLCQNPKYRRLYGRGQPIPGHVNRIWLIREQAPIMEKTAPPRKGD